MYLAKKSRGSKLVAIKDVESPSLRLIFCMSASDGNEYSETIWLANLLSEASD